MLENLLNSKLKKKLLQIFFALPQRGFSAAELKEMSGGRKGQLLEALRGFVKAQVVSIGTKRQKRFFRINPHFRLYGELEDLVSEGYLEVEDLVAKRLKQIPNLKLAVLSGVFTLEPQLPVDLLLVGQGINRLRLLRILTEIEKLIGQELNYTIMSPEEYEYRQLMNDRLVRDLLDYPHLIVFNTLK